MLKLKIPNFLKFSKATWRHIRVGAFAILIAGLLQVTSSFPLLIGVTLFSFFRLYLFIEKTNHKLKKQKSKIKELKKIIEETSEQTKVSYEKEPPAPIIEKEYVKEVVSADPEQQQAISKLENNLNGLLIMIEEVNQAVIQNKGDITNLEDSLVKFSHKVNEIEKLTSSALNQPIASNTIIDQTGLGAPKDQALHEEAGLISGRYQNFPKLGSKLVELQLTFQQLSALESQQLDIQQLKDTLMKCIYLMQELTQRVDYIVDLNTDLKEFNYRLSRIESSSNTGLPGQIVPIVQETHQRTITLEEKMKVLSASLKETGQLLNKRVDDFSYILQSALTRTQAGVQG